MSAEVSLPAERLLCSQMFLSVAAVLQTFHLGITHLPVGWRWAALSGCQWGHGTASRPTGTVLLYLKGAGLKMINDTTCFAHVCLSARSPSLLQNICFLHQQITTQSVSVFVCMCVHVCVLIISCVWVSFIPACFGGFELLSSFSVSACMHMCLHPGYCVFMCVCVWHSRPVLNQSSQYKVRAFVLVVVQPECRLTGWILQPGTPLKLIPCVCVCDLTAASKNTGTREHGVGLLAAASQWHTVWVLTFRLTFCECELH